MVTKAIPLFFAFLFLLTGLAHAKPSRIVVVGGTAYAPMAFSDGLDNSRGIYVDIWRLWSKKTGVPVDYRCMEWADALEMVAEGKADAVGGLFFNETRSKIYDFSPPYFEVTTSIFFHKNIYGIKEIKDLSGFRVGVVHGDSSEEFIQKNEPQISLVSFPSPEEMVRAASKGDVRVFICDTPAALFYLSKIGKENDFKYSTSPIITNKTYAGVKKGDSALLKLISDGFRVISSQEIEKIKHQWTGISPMDFFPWRPVLITGLSLLFSAVLLILWNVQLRRKVAAILNVEWQVQERTETNRELKREISERRRAECELRESRDLLSAVIKAIPMSIFSKNREGLYWFSNDEFAQCVGIPAAEIEGKTVYECWPPDQARFYNEEGMALMEEGGVQIYEHRVPHAKKGVRDGIVTRACFYHQDGSVAGLVGTFLDITDRKRAEEALAASEKKYYDLFNNAAIPLWEEDLSEFKRGLDTLRASGIEDFKTHFKEHPELRAKSLSSIKVLHINKAALKMYKAKSKEELLEHLGNLVPEKAFDTMIEWYIGVVVSHLRSYRYETFNYTLAGEKLDLIFKCTLMPGYEETLSKVLVSAIDITERKRAEEALQKAHDVLEQRVGERTAELLAKNRQLEQEIGERKRAQGHIRTLTQQLITAQENERQRISRDLHDQVAQELAALKIGYDTLLDNHSTVPQEIRQRVFDLSQTLQGSIAAVRDLAYDLSPSGLDPLGLVRTVSRYCNDFSEKNGANVDFFSAGIDGLELCYDTVINLYRVIQEALNNIRKHAHASQVSIRLLGSFPNIILRIEDNGKGFDVKKRLADALTEKRMGIQSMEERVRLLNGKITIQSGLMKGTKIFIEVPYQEKRRRDSAVINSTTS